MINLLSILIITSNIYAIPYTTSNKQLDEVTQAINDAIRDAKIADVSAWSGMGCMFGIFGVASSYIIEPYIPATNLIGKSPKYIVIYTEQYRSQLKQKRIKAATTGCIIGNGIVIGLITFYINIDSN